MDPEGTIGSALESWLQEPAFQNQLVSGSLVVASKGWDISLFKYAGLWVQATSVSATPSVRVYYEMAYADQAALYAIPEGYGDLITSLADANPHVLPVVIAPMKYMRVCVSGSLSNPADTIFNAVLFLHQ